MATIDDVLIGIPATRQQALDWIFFHVDQPDIIFETAFTHGVTTAMLSDLTGYSSNIIKSYFINNGSDPELLDDVGILFNSDLGSYAHLVGSNNHSGILSTDSLRAEVKPLFENPTLYEEFFAAIFDYQAADGIYSPDELGVSHLGSIPATNSNIESIFYGTLLNIGKSLDLEEFKQITEFSVNDTNFDQFIGIVHDALSDSPSTPIPDDLLKDAVIEHAHSMIKEYWNDATLIGILDHSPLLGLVLLDS